MNETFRRVGSPDVLLFVLSCLILLQYTPAIDIWSVGCIFAEMLTGRPLFPGRNVVHQLDLMTDFLGTPPAETISKVSLVLKFINSACCFCMSLQHVGSSTQYLFCKTMQIRNEKARRYLNSMRKKHPVPFMQKFPNADPLALCLLERLLAFDPKARPTAEEVVELICFNSHFLFIVKHSSDNSL